MGTNGIEQVFYILARAATKNRTIDGACMGAAPQRGPWPPLSRHCLVLAALRPGFKGMLAWPAVLALAALPLRSRGGCGLAAGCGRALWALPVLYPHTKWPRPKGGGSISGGARPLPRAAALRPSRFASGLKL